MICHAAGQSSPDGASSSFHRDSVGPVKGVHRSPRKVIKSAVGSIASELTNSHEQAGSNL